MAQVCSGVYCGFITVSVRHNLYMNITADISHSGSTVTLSSIACHLYMDVGSVTYGTASRTWGLKNSDKSVSKTTTVSYNGTWSTRDFNLPTMSFNLAASSTSTTLYITGPDGDFAFTLANIPTGYTAPTGLSVSNLSATQNSITGTVSVSGWGTHSSSATYLELVISKTKSTDLDKRRYEWGPSGDTSLSKTYTCSNSSGGTMTITPNSSYYVGAFASNGNKDTGFVWNWGPITTLPAGVTNLECVSMQKSGSGVQAEITCQSISDGGALQKTFYLRSHNGSSWSSWEQITEDSGDFDVMVSNLPGKTTVKVQVKSSTTAGDSNISEISFVTMSVDAGRFYVSHNGVAKPASKIYASSPNFMNIESIGGEEVHNYLIPSKYQELSYIETNASTRDDIYLIQSNEDVEIFLDIEIISISSDSRIPIITKNLESAESKIGTLWGVEDKKFIGTQIPAIGQRKKIFLKFESNKITSIIDGHQYEETSLTQKENEIYLVNSNLMKIKIHKLVVGRNNSPFNYFIPVEELGVTVRTGLLDILQGTSKKVINVYASNNGYASPVFSDID